MGVGPRALRASDLPLVPLTLQGAADCFVGYAQSFEEEMDSGTFLTLRGAADLTLAGAAADLTTLPGYAQGVGWQVTLTWAL